MANTAVVTNDSTAAGSSFLFPSSLANPGSEIGGGVGGGGGSNIYNARNSQPISKLEYQFSSFLDTSDYNSMGASTSATDNNNSFHYYQQQQTAMEQATGGLDVSQFPSTSNLQQPSMLNTSLLCEQKPRIHALAKRKGISKNAAGSSLISASQPNPNPEGPDADEQRLPLSCQLIEPLRLRISSSSTRRGGSMDSPGTPGSSSAAHLVVSSLDSQSSSTPTTAAIYNSNHHPQQQQQPFNFLQSPFLASHNLQQKQDFMAHLLGAINQQQPTTSNFWQDFPNMWNLKSTFENTQMGDQPPTPKVPRIMDDFGGESLDQALEHLSDVEQDVVVLREVVTTPKPKKLVPSDHYTGEVITLDDEDEEDSSADSFNETFSDVEEDEEEEEKEEEKDDENDTKLIEASEEKDDLREYFKHKLEKISVLKSSFAKYKKKAEKKENKLIDRLKFERKKNLELSEECSTINRKLKESEMVRVHMQDGLDTLEELRTENFQLRQTSESRLVGLNNAVQAKLDLQDKLESLREQNKRLADEKERQSREHTCVICLDAKREILFMPCLHFNTCEPCSKTSVMTHCGTCRQMIMGKLKVYQ